MPTETSTTLTRAAAKICIICLLSICLLINSTASHGREMAFVCENNGLTRSVEVVSDSEFACRVRYTKSTGSTYPWSARNEAAYCGSKALFLVDKLKSWGWNCDSAEDVRSILNAHIERYHRHIKILGNVGKTCNFYPAEVQFGNLCGGPRPEGAIVYTCETDGDDWEQHLTVFLELESEPLIMEVGGSRSRQVTSYHIDNRRLLMETQSFDPAQPATSPDYASVECRSGAESSWQLYENRSTAD